METIEVKPDVMVILCQKAEREGKPITDFIDEMLRKALINGSTEQTVILKCNKCKGEIDYEISYSQGYCDHCECVVFIDKE